MQFEALNEAGVLEIDYSGSPLDLYAFGILHINIQEIIDKVALMMLLEQGILDPSWRRPRSLPFRVPRSQPLIVKAEIHSVQVGSLFEALTFAIPVVLADPNVRAVLQNLTANLLWGVGMSGIRGY